MVINCASANASEILSWRNDKSEQAQRQDSVTGGGEEINFGEAREVYLCEFERGTGLREVYSSVDQTKKVKTKKKVLSTKIFTNSCCRLKILAIFREFLIEPPPQKKAKKKFLETRFEFTKIAAVNTDLGVFGFHLHSSSPEPVNFFGAQSSLGGTIFVWGAHAVIWGGTSPECPSVAPGLCRRCLFRSINIVLYVLNVNLCNISFYSEWFLTIPNQYETKTAQGNDITIEG